MWISRVPRLAAWIVAAAAVTPRAAWTGEMTPAQLAEIARASSARYVSLSAEYHFVRQAAVRPGGERVPTETGTVTWRWQDDRTFFRQEYSAPGTAGRKTLSVTVIGRGWLKLFREEEGASSARIVGRREAPLETDPIRAMFRGWSAHHKPLREISRARAAVVEEMADGHYRLTCVFQYDTRELDFTQIIAPEYGYAAVATKEQWRGTDPVATECSGFTKYGDLWLPQRYSCDSVESVVEFTLLNAQVNAPLTDEELDFKFPPGTYVRDEIAGVNYTVEEITREAARASAERVIVDPQDLRVAPPLSEATLEDAARRVREEVARSPQEEPPAARNGAVWIAAVAVLGMALCAVAWGARSRRRRRPEPT